MPSRPSLSRKAKSTTAHIPSLLQQQLERAIDSPGGIQKILTTIQHASNHDIKILNDNKWSPLIGAIFRLGKNTTRNGNKRENDQTLMRLLRTCHARNLSLDNGAYFAAHFHRPLTIAAYFGFYSGVRTLLELGALPDLTDGEGKTAWHTAFDNPCISCFSNSSFRECDRLTAETMLEIGAVTSSLGDWRASNDSRTGSISYINAESKIGSPLYRALLNKRVEVIRFIVENGGSISDREYLILYRRGGVKRLLVRMVGKLNERVQLVPHCDSMNAKYLNWSFPPSWKEGVELCIAEWDRCGLPPNIFQSKVVPYLSREWFFTNEALKVLDLPTRLAPSDEGEI